MTTFLLHTEFITLGQLLKATGVVDYGGEVKSYLADHEVFINGELDVRRGRKLYSGDRVELPGQELIEIVRGHSD